MELTYVSVRQLNMFVRSILEENALLNAVVVFGEISNLRQYNSGHLYFTLKDENASINAVMFSGNVQMLNFVPQNGMSVIVRAKVTIYEKDGTYQLVCQVMTLNGKGAIDNKKALLKERLLKEGLFDKAIKKPIPAFPNKIGIVTSKDGAVLHDVISVLSRRFPIAELTLYSSSVQGDTAPYELINALNLADSDNNDVLIIARGGGSEEDLEAFNNEELVRAVCSTKTPIISAVGHETDYTLCDLAADLRAPTPSSAAELAVPDIADIKNILTDISSKINTNLESLISLYQNKINSYKQKAVFKEKHAVLNNYSEKLHNVKNQLNFYISNIISKNENALSLYCAKIDALSPLKILSRGYSLVLNNNKVVKTKDDIKKDDVINIKTFNDDFSVIIKDIE